MIVLKWIYILSVLGSVTVSQASEADERVERAAGKSYVFRTLLKRDAVMAECRNGVVFLSGTVSDPGHKLLAENIVEILPGVRRVDNRLQVRGSAFTVEADGWLSVKIKSLLGLHRTVSDASTEVVVVNGIVTLRGQGVSLAQIQAIGEFARDVEGARLVRNEMTLAKSSPVVAGTAEEMIDDASVTAQVKAALLAHHSSSELKVRVETILGVVNLHGVVRDSTQKALVSRLIEDIHGLSKIVNNLTLDGEAANVEK
ncbi:MAG TPA: BON domain-containing protein [Candidatus Limnocylindria bacterium]|jgi:osmotically-inducible protein OsmY|nr:BON domain-containing protein [Candidatus Limnocylindria bacterium]